MSSSVDNQVRQLRSYAMRGKWQEVFEMYKQERVLHTAKMTVTGDTVLHMAVSSGKEKVVANLVDLLVSGVNERPQNNVVLIVDREGEESSNVNIILGAENNRKNTPLHLAAMIGNVEMCKKIGGKDPSLIARRNIVGETPLFLAALYGKKKVFLWHHYLYMESPGVSSTDLAHCIRDNEDTILHCAVSKGHFDVAVEIIHLYKELVRGMRRNKVGLSPLHLLAAQRSAFKSTDLHDLPVLRPIYWVFIVKEKNQATTFEELQKKTNIWLTTFIKFIKFISSLLLPLLLYTFYPSALSFLLPLLVVFVVVFVMFPFSGAAGRVLQIRKMKNEHTWSLQIMNELLQHASDGDMSQILSRTPSEQLSISLQTEEDNAAESGTITIETPLIIAVRNGIIEMVKKILELFPSRIEDVNAKRKNILLLAVEYRQKEIFMFLHKQKWLSESLIWQVDKDGNNALHLAIGLEVELDRDSLGEAHTILRKINWFHFVKELMPYDLLERYNRKMETPDNMLKETLKQFMKSEGEWLAKTSKACSVVSTLIVGVAFATRTNVPGGFDDKGYAILRNESEFKIFARSSFAALFSSLFSTICFLSIVASPSQTLHWPYVPVKLYFGTFSMFTSIVCLWISFSFGDFFMSDGDTLQAPPIPLLTNMLCSLMIVVLLLAQIPIFLNPVFFSISTISTSRHKATLPIEYRRTKNEENGTELGHQN